MKPNFATESALAKVVTTWLHADGWATFHEVECWGGRADIVAARRGLVWLIETKLRAGLEVLVQALDKRRAGVIAVSEVDDFDEQTSKLVRAHRAEMLAWPAFYRQAKSADLLRSCKPEHAAQPAGTPGHQLLVSQLALAEAVREYKRGFEAAQLRRWLCQAVQPRPLRPPHEKPPAGYLPCCSLVGRGKARSVVLDVAGLTPQHRRDYQLHELDQRLAAGVA